MSVLTHDNDRRCVHLNNNEQKELNTGFSNESQIDMSIKAAQKMVGSATMSMDKELLQNATNALQDARTQLTNAQNVDSDFLQRSEQALSQSEEQLNEAKQ